jgi:type IV secretion system protein VirB4
MEDKCRDFESLMAETNPERLSLYDHNGVLFSQPMEVLHFILTGDRIRVPLLDGRLGQALYSSRIVFGQEAAEIRLPTRAIISACSACANMSPPRAAASSTAC